MNIKLTPKQHLDIYYQVVAELNLLENEKHALVRLAEDAGIHLSTLYNWINQKVECPNLRTLFNVAWCLGYEMVLQRRKVKLQKIKSKKAA